MHDSGPPVTPVEGAKHRLTATIATLDDATCEVLETIVQGLSCRVQIWTTPDTDIVVPAFGQNFLTRLQLHHATHEEFFKKKTFEFAFKAACIAAGRRAEMDPDVTSPGYDVVVEGLRYSLKTESGARISQRHIKISKLMEARWIRECRTGEDYRRGCDKILQHFTHYDRVLVLRAFRVGKPFRGVRYDLIEIPLRLLQLIRDLGADDFATRNASSGSSSASVTDRGVEVFKLRLDGSVEKVTIEKLAADRCRSHASWTVETLLAGTDEE